MALTLNKHDLAECATVCCLFTSYNPLDFGKMVKSALALCKDGVPVVWCDAEVFQDTFSIETLVQMSGFEESVIDNALEANKGNDPVLTSIIECTSVLQTYPLVFLEFGHGDSIDDVMEYARERLKHLSPQKKDTVTHAVHGFSSQGGVIIIHGYNPNYKLYHNP